MSSSSTGWMDAKCTLKPAIGVGTGWRQRILAYDGGGGARGADRMWAGAQMIEIRAGLEWEKGAGAAGDVRQTG